MDENEAVTISHTSPLPYYLIYFELGFKRFSVKRGENYCSFKHQSVPKELKVK